MHQGRYPGRLTRQQWLALSVSQRCLLAARAQSDLLGLWKSCRKKPCRRGHACHGDKRCKSKPWQTDLNNPNLGDPDFKFSYRPPEHLRIPGAILDQLPYLPAPSPPQEIVAFAAAEAGAEAAAALRPIFGLERRRRRGKKGK